MDARRRRFPFFLDVLRGRLRGVGSGQRGALALSALLVSAGAGLSLLETPLWWFGGALLIAGATVLGRALRDPWAAAAERLRAPRSWSGIELSPLALCLEALCVGAVLSVGTVMMWDVTGGERPVSHDHTVHYARAFRLHEQLLPSGRLFGFSHDWFAGLPANYLDPPGADLWVNAVHALSFGTISFSRAYAYAFWFFYLFAGLAVYRLGRLAGGRWVGLIAAVLFLTDLSGFRLGGWADAVVHGAWPEALSLSFGLMALCSLPGIVLERRLAPMAAFGVWMGLAIITHPIQLVVLCILFVCAALAAGFAAGVNAATALFRLALACGLSMLVASMWLIPFFGAHGEANRIGALWETTYELGKGVLHLRPMEGTLPWVFAFGVLGVVLALRARDFLLLFVGFTALCIPAISNSTFIDEFHLAAMSAGLVKVQFARLSAVAKPFWFVLAGYMAVAAVVHARRLSPGGAELRALESHGRAALLAGLIGLLTWPVLVPSAQAFWTRHVRKTIAVESTRESLTDRRRLEQWLRSSLPQDGFYRVGIFTGQDHDLMDLGPLLERPIYKRGSTPASNFIYQMKDKDPAILEAVNLRFAISKQALPSDEFEPVTDFGRYRVYRFKRWQPNPFRVLAGEGDVRLERFEDEEIVLHAGAGARGKLQLNVSYFSRWRAYRDGQRVPITLTYLREAPEETGFITVPLAPGRYRFAFERTLGDRLAIPLGLFGLALCAALLAVDRRARPLALLHDGLHASYAWLDRWSSPAFRARRIALALIAGTGLLASGLALARWRPPIALHELPGVAIERVRFDFLENLARASASIEYAESNQPCKRQGDRLVCRDSLGNLDNERYVASTPAHIIEERMDRCIRARPEPSGLLSITYPSVPAGEAIVGYFGIERAGRSTERRLPVEFRIAVDGQTILEQSTRADDKLHWFKADLPRSGRRRAPVTFSVRADNVSKRFFCFHAQMADLR
jgi:hypothetical protein